MNGSATPGWYRPLRGAVLPLLLIAVAQISFIGATGENYSTAPPTEIAVSGIRLLFDGSMLHATLLTLTTTFGGLALGSTIGVLAGVVMGLIPAVGKSLDLLVELLRPIPSIALIPIGLLVLGFGPDIEISIIAFATTWPMLIFSRSAVGGIEQQLLETAQILEMPYHQKLYKIVIPAMLPRLFVGLRLSAGIALIVAIGVEIFANPRGIGHELMFAQETLRPDKMYAYLVWLAGLGWAMNWLLLKAEQWLFGDLADAGRSP